MNYGMVLDFLIPALIVAFNEFSIRQTRGGLVIPRTTNLFYAICLCVVWVAQDFGVIPRWLGMVLTGIVIIAYVIGTFPGGGPKGRKRRIPSWKQAKKWLATGMPARRPVTG